MAEKNLLMILSVKDAYSIYAKKLVEQWYKYKPSWILLININ